MADANLPEIVFWQTCLSPHVVGLAEALCRQGAAVVYVAGHGVSPERVALGWSAPEVPGVRLVIIEDSGIRAVELLETFSMDVVHVVQGLRRNGYIRYVIPELKRHNARWGAMIETVDNTGLKGILRRLDYRIALHERFGAPHFVLAIGAKTDQWVAGRGFGLEHTFPFGYFLPAPAGDGPIETMRTTNSPFQFGFVGQINNRKRLDLLIEALKKTQCSKWNLIVIGSGPLEGRLKQAISSEFESGRVQWFGTMPLERARVAISAMDCVVLPSDHDGWGAVVSEALMRGVPVICSDACGAAEAVKASGMGGIFPQGDVHALSVLLRSMMEQGPTGMETRKGLALWARCLGGDAGATYLMDILHHLYGDGERPLPPWKNRASVLKTQHGRN